jgi:hypothetical protein
MPAQLRPSWPNRAPQVLQADTCATTLLALLVWKTPVVGTHLQVEEGDEAGLAEEWAIPRDIVGDGGIPILQVGIVQVARPMPVRYSVL